MVGLLTKCCISPHSVFEQTMKVPQELKPFVLQNQASPNRINNLLLSIYIYIYICQYMSVYYVSILQYIQLTTVNSDDSNDGLGTVPGSLSSNKSDSRRIL